MNLVRFAVFACVLVVSLIATLIFVRGPNVFTLDRIAGPKLPIAQFAEGELTAPEPGAQLETPSSVPAGAPVPTFGSGPGIPPPAPRLLASSSSDDPNRIAGYRKAIDAITVIGCDSNRRAALKIAGQNKLVMVKSGDVVELGGSIALVARIVDMSRCKIQLLDHGRAVGEVASF